MALRDQPYLPLYVQDFLTDEKLIECSASTTGIYIRLMCIMHKSDDYGKILLKQKDKQNGEQILNFALKLARQMPYQTDEIQEALKELIEEGVLHIENNVLYQKRMVHDNLISEKRAISGQKGGQFAQAKFKANIEAKDQANTEIENEYEIENKSAFVNTNKYAGENFDLSFVCEDYQRCFKTWIDYRQSGKKPFRNQAQIEAAYKELLLLSRNSPASASNIVNQSIANDYISLFALKQVNDAPMRVNPRHLPTSEEHLMEKLQ